jgi:hypothetical protein
MQWIFVIRQTNFGPAAHAIAALENTLSGSGISYEITNSHLGSLHDGLIFLGAGNEAAIFRQTAQTPAEPEAFSFCRSGLARLLSAGGELGLAYGIFELAERIGEEGESVLSDWSDMLCKPVYKMRGVDRFITNSQDESWWMNCDYWDFYFTMLLSSRFNNFTLLFGFDTAYFSPPYPFLVNVPGFEEVRVSEAFKFDREAYLEALNRIGAMCHDYGLTFTVGMWQMVPWQTGQSKMVDGLETENIEAYCAAGLRALLAACPHIDRIHFRVNHESGVGDGNDSAEEFWLRQIDALAQFNSENNRDVELELRAKGMTDRMVEHGKKCGLKVTVSTKHWCEQAGLPYHVTRMRSEEMKSLSNLNASRRYSYADMLRRPRLHSFLFRLWNNGSTNLFTWGSPDYARRFMDSLKLGESDGFEVMAPLSYKGGQQYCMADQPWPLFDDPAFQPEGFEESRYWLFYRLFGRIGYDINEDEAAWMRPVRARFGKAAQPIMEMISSMSMLIPYIVAFHFPSHPQQMYWAELDTGGALFRENTYNWIHKLLGVTYQKALPSDEGLFYGIEQYAADMLSGKTDGRITPHQSAARVRDIVDKTSLMLAEAEKVGLPDTSEARGVVLDAKMLVLLGRYHIEKINAALGISLFNLTEEFGYVHNALEHMHAARDFWAKLSALGKTYHAELNFSIGVGQVNKGTWSDALVELDADIACLEAMSAGGQASQEVARAADISPVYWRTGLPEVHPAGKDLRVTLDTCNDGRASSPVRLRWRRNNHLDGLFNTLTMESCDEGLCAVIPGGEMLPEWDIMVYFETTDKTGDAVQYPGMLHPELSQPYFIVKIAGV